MPTALALVEPQAPVVSAEQEDLVKRTVANGATVDELKLYLYDCARQGVHPLDRLIHFTKRKDKNGNSKYTPITSIDFMRTRAADTGEYAGSDDAVYSGDPKKEGFSASVTVYRMVQGQRCPFTATARWVEYKPERDDFMWQKMPHTMLGKCSEALALRKGFPRQLAGLYAKEEMDQAGPVVTESIYDKQPTYPQPDVHIREVASGEATSPASYELTIRSVDITDTKNKNVKRYLVNLSDGRQAVTINRALGTRCKEYSDAAAAVEVVCHESRFGLELDEVSSPSDPKSTETVTLDASAIPF